MKFRIFHSDRIEEIKWGLRKFYRSLEKKKKHLFVSIYGLLLHFSRLSNHLDSWILEPQRRLFFLKTGLIWKQLLLTEILKNLKSDKGGKTGSIIPLYPLIRCRTPVMINQTYNRFVNNNSRSWASQLPLPLWEASIQSSWANLSSCCSKNTFYSQRSTYN
jgi:hypothetical protein